MWHRNPRDVLAELVTSASLLALNGSFERAVAEYGFNAFAGGILRPGEGNTFVLMNWPESWIRFYAANGIAADDVVVGEAISNPDPFTWADIRRRRPGASERVFQAAAEFGWSDGFVVPIHGPSDQRGVVSLASPCQSLVRADYQPLVEICVTAFGRGLALLHQAQSAPGVELSPRERAALSFVAAGKDDAEIAVLLSVSRATAHAHVERAKRRLGVSTRAHAVAVAVRAGLI